MGLFTPWYEHRNWLNAKRVAETTNNQNKLKEAALKASFYAIRSIAASRVTDDDFLFALVYSDKDIEVQSAAAGALHSRDMLTSIAYDQKIAIHIRLKAARKIADAKLADELEEQCNLEEALFTHSQDVGWSVIGRLKTMESLIICARKCSNAVNRQWAISRIHDDDVLEKLINDIGEEYDAVYETKYSDVLESAIKQVKSEHTLERLMESKYKSVRSLASSRITDTVTDTALLAKIARHDVEISVRYKAAKRLPEEMFKELCATDPEIGARYKHESELHLSNRGSFTDDSSDWVKSVTERD